MPFAGAGKGTGGQGGGSSTSDLDGGVGDGRAGEHEHAQVLPRLLRSGLQDPAAHSTAQLPQLPINTR